MKTKKYLLLLCAFVISQIVRAQSWEQLSDFAGTKRDDGVAFLVGNKIYCGTGLQVGWSATRDFYAMDLSTELWQQVQDMPAGQERQYATAFSYNDVGYVFGGTNNAALNDLWMYNQHNNTWLQKANKPGIGLSGACVFVLDGIAYFVGGNNSSTNASNEVWAYNINSDTWAQKSNFPFGGLWRASATSLNGKGYLMFGKDSAGSFNNSLYKYNSSTDSWTLISTFPLPGRAYSSLSSIASNLVVFGGVDSSNIYYNDLWYFQLYDSTWHQKNSLPSVGRKGGMAVSTYNTLYYTTGIDAQNNRLGETWKVDYPTVIDEKNDNSTIGLSPNPCKNEITLALDSKFVYDITLQNISGETVKIIYKTNQKNIDASELSSGMYYLIVSGNSMKKVLKFVKQ